MQDGAGRKGKGKDRGSISSHPLMRRSSNPPPLPGGLLNFARFETSNIDGLIEFLQELISSSAKANRVSEERMKSNVKVMATGGGAHMYYDRLRRDLGVEVLREEEMECLILGLGFIAHVPEEVFWFSEELVYKVSPSPSPPSYQVTFAPTPNNAGETVPVFPCLVVNIGSGVSIVKVDENGEFERVSGTSLGGGTLWGLLSMLTDARTFDGELTCNSYTLGLWADCRNARALGSGRQCRCRHASR
jgi:type II pantothenate kinase